jgi:hypothetical protein
VEKWNGEANLIASKVRVRARLETRRSSFHGIGEVRTTRKCQIIAAQIIAAQIVAAQIVAAQIVAAKMRFQRTGYAGRYA